MPATHGAPKKSYPLVAKRQKSRTPWSPKRQKSAFYLPPGARPCGMCGGRGSPSEEGNAEQDLNYATHHRRWAGGSSPGDLRIPQGRPKNCRKLAVLGLLAEKIALQEAFKNVSNFDVISTSIFDRLGSVLEAKMGPKSIKNRSKLGFRAFLFRHRFLY